MTEWSRIARRIRVPLGFAFAAFYVWIARPSCLSLALGTMVAVPGILLRALASGHVKKNQEVTTSGPYAYTRNPLYLGSIILVIGFGVASRNLWLAVALLMIFIALYLPVIRDEENFLRMRFPEFTDYAERVPRIVPRLSPSDSPAGFSSDLYRKHREYNAALGSVGMMILLILKLHFLSR